MKWGRLTLTSFVQDMKVMQKKGQSVIEIVVALAIFLIIVGSSMITILGSLSISKLGEEEARATTIAVEGLEAVGLEALPPRATLYVWARIPNSGHEDGAWTSEEFALKLLTETGVALAPGPFFGPGGEGYVRVSVTASTARIREATQRIRQFANAL